MTPQQIQDVQLYIGLATSIIALLFLLIGGVAGIFIFFQLAPILALRILPTWADEKKEHLVIRFEVENKSRVRITRPKIRLQVIEQKVAPSGAISQWVPFTKEAVRQGEQLVEWRDPIEISETTARMYPSEIIVIERLYHCPQASLILHIALQVEVKLGLWGRVVTRKTQDWRQTTTCFVVK
jgi:hypothetical protein